MQTMTQMSAREAISDWPRENQHEAEVLIDRYGQPRDVTANHLAWFDNGAWKRTVIYRTSVPHDFPKQHRDFLKQTIDYKVPVDRACDLLRFDGSILIDRTAGEISARCDTESANYLMLNLADQICSGRMGADEARRLYIENITKLMQNQMTPMMEGLQFSVQTLTADPDSSSGM